MDLFDAISKGMFVAAFVMVIYRVASNQRSPFSNMFLASLSAGHLIANLVFWRHGFVYALVSTIALVVTVLSMRYVLHRIRYSQEKAATNARHPS